MQLAHDFNQSDRPRYGATPLSPSISTPSLAIPLSVVYLLLRQTSRSEKKHPPAQRGIELQMRYFPSAANLAELLVCMRRKSFGNASNRTRLIGTREYHVLIVASSSSPPASGVLSPLASPAILPRPPLDTAVGISPMNPPGHRGRVVLEDAWRDRRTMLNVPRSDARCWHFSTSGSHVRVDRCLVYSA